MITAVDADPIANGPDQITFASNISGATISLQSPLPALTRDQVTITGPINLDGTSAGGDGLDISGNQDSIQNLAINSFSGAGISITGSNDTITGSQITGTQNGIVVAAGSYRQHHRRHGHRRGERDHGKHQRWDRPGQRPADRDPGQLDRDRFVG